MTCAVCNGPSDPNTVGFRFRPTTFFMGQKSAMLIPEEDAFPDGETEKFICYDCMPEEVLEAVGFFEGGMRY